MNLTVYKMNFRSTIMAYDVVVITTVTYKSDTFTCNILCAFFIRGVESAPFIIVHYAM